MASFWDGLHNGDPVELGLIQVDIAGHSKLPGPDSAIQEAKSILKKQMEGIAGSREGRQMGWKGDGGAFMFQTGPGRFDALVFSAVAMLSNMRGINEEIATRANLETALEVRISCDSGVVSYNADPGLIHGDFLNRFMKNERNISEKNRLMISHRIWKQLTPRLQRRFDHSKFSEEIDSEIYVYRPKAALCDFDACERDLQERLREEMEKGEVSKIEIDDLALDMGSGIEGLRKLINAVIKKKTKLIYQIALLKPGGQNHCKECTPASVKAWADVVRARTRRELSELRKEFGGRQVQIKDQGVRQTADCARDRSAQPVQSLVHIFLSLGEKAQQV